MTAGNSMKNTISAVPAECEGGHPVEPVARPLDIQPIPGNLGPGHLRQAPACQQRGRDEHQQRQPQIHPQNAAHLRNRPAVPVPSDSQISSFLVPGGPQSVPHAPAIYALRPRAASIRRGPSAIAEVGRPVPNAGFQHRTDSQGKIRMTQYDLVGIGNALVDVLAKIEDSFLATHDLPKGAMILVEADQSKPCTTSWAARWRSRAGPAATRWPASPRWVARAPISARCATTSSATSSAAISRPNIVDTSRATPISAARWSASSPWSTASCCWSTRPKGRCRRPSSSP